MCKQAIVVMVFVLMMISGVLFVSAQVPPTAVSGIYLYTCLRPGYTISPCLAGYQTLVCSGYPLGSPLCLDTDQGIRPETESRVAGYFRPVYPSTGPGGVQWAPL